MKFYTRSHVGTIITPFAVMLFLFFLWGGWADVAHAQGKPPKGPDKGSQLSQAENWNRIEAARLFEYGLSLHRERQLQTAIRTYRKALDLYPKLHEARLNLAGALIDSGKLDHAEANLARLDDLLPGDDRVVFNRALLLTLRGGHAGALTILGELEVREDAPLQVYLLKAAILLKLKKPKLKEAEAVMKAGLKSYPVEFAPYYQYARYLDKLGRTSEAIVAYGFTLTYLPKRQIKLGRLIRLRLRSLRDSREKKAKPEPKKPAGVKDFLK